MVCWAKLRQVLFSVILCLFHYPLRQLPFSPMVVIWWLPNSKHCSSTCCLHVPRVASTCCLHALRADITTFTSSARCAWRSSPLFACCWHCSFCHGSWGPNPGCFLHGFSGPNPWLFVHGFSGPNPWLFDFLHGRLARVFSLRV